MSELRALWSAGWQALARGAAEADHAMHLVALATVAEDGGPAARFVVLRAADPAEAWLEVHTDIETVKVAEVRARGVATILAWDPVSGLQARARARVEIRTGEEVRAQWEAVPPTARVSYGTEPAPGTVIPGPLAYDKPPVFERFAVLRLVVEDLDLVDLNEPHRRAVFSRPDGFAGAWLAP